MSEPSKYVKLVSSDGFEYIILRELAMISPTLSSMLDENFEFQEKKVVDYLYYNRKYSDQDDVPDFDIPTEMALELLVAADFLNI